MLRRENDRYGKRSVSKIITLLLLIGLLTGCVPTAAQPPVHVTGIQPELLLLAAQQPETIIRVIVQQTAAANSSTTGGIATLVEELGGAVTKDLSIINALAVELPARALPQLATSPNVRWISLDGPVESAGKGGGKPDGGDSTADPVNYYLDTLNVRPVWSMGLQGQGVTVAVVDSGITNDADFITGSSNRLLKKIKLNPNAANGGDSTGHGTHVAGIIGGNGTDSNGLYQGVAPGVNLISLRISDDVGMAYESDTVAALQWVLDNRSSYNIRVVNLSINSTVTQSYHTSPLNAAAEILWFNGIVVVASAGNKGPSGSYNTANAAPANDPFIITVGATDERGTSTIRRHEAAPYSAFGNTTDGFAKPDIMAPGSNIYSVLSLDSDWDTLAPDRAALNNQYFRLSGTSMAAPMVSAAAALLLQDEPNLTPDQVKYRLLHTGSKDIDPGSGARVPYLNVYGAVTGNTTQSANTGLTASQLLWGGTEPVTWSSVSWNSVSWNSVSWNSVSWNSVSWNSVSWNSVSWND